MDDLDRETSVVVGLAIRRPAMNILASTSSATAKSRTAMALVGEPDNSLQVGDVLKIGQALGSEPIQQGKNRPRGAKLEVTGDNS